MNPVSLAMDGLLAVLLVVAVTIGLRLNAKLKLLRESQGGFVKAVADLDGAAQRAESGLAQLRVATQEAHDQLLTRIETARTLSARLDRASEDASTASARLEEAVRGAESAARRAQAASAQVERFAERPAARPAPVPANEPIPFPSLRGEPAEPALRAALMAAERIVAETDEDDQAPLPASLRPAPRAVAAPAPGGRLAGFMARRRSARA